MPSRALNVTGSGVTSCAAGKSRGHAIGARATCAPLPPAIGTTAGSGERCAVDARNATDAPSPVTTGLHSSPAPLVSAVGGAAVHRHFEHVTPIEVVASAPVFAL